MSGQLSPTGRFERLLLATDASDFGRGAERVALAMAAQHGSALHVASVVITNPVAETVAPDLILAAEKDARAVLERMQEQAAARGIATEAQVLRGIDPFEEIAALAEKDRSDVIVIGRRDKTRLLHRVLADATASVLGRAHCSVLVVPEDADMWQRRVLLATDGSRFADAAAVAAAAIASTSGLPVTVLSVVRPTFTEERAQQAVAAAARVHALLVERGLQAEQQVLHGDPAELIVKTAAERGADVIIMGTHGRTGLERVLVGSVAEAVVRNAALPVLAVKL